MLGTWGGAFVGGAQRGSADTSTMPSLLQREGEAHRTWSHWISPDAPGDRRTEEGSRPDADDECGGW